MDIWKIIKILSHLLTVGLLIMVIRDCSRAPQEQVREIVYQTKTDTVYITKTVTTTAYKPTVVRVTDTVNVYAVVDTAAIVKDYLSSKLYADTISFTTKDNKMGYVIVNDLISKNNIISRNTVWSITNPISITANSKNNRGFYYGVDVGINNTGISNTSFNVVYLNNANMYKAGLGVVGNGDGLAFTINAGLYFRLQNNKQ